MRRRDPKKIKRKIILTLFLLGFLLLGYYSVIFEPNNLQVEEEVIVIKNLPKGFDGARIIHLTDFHSLWFSARERRVLRIVENLEPDFIFITGDFIDPVTKFVTDRELRSVRVFWQELAKQHQNRVFAVLGNHDSKRVGKYLEEEGIRVLDNEHKKIFFDDNYIYLVGVDDPWTGRDNLPKAIEGIRANVPKILLAHAGEIIYEAVEQKIDLVLVGHTHGGQVNLPFLGRLFQQLSEYGLRYTNGLFKIEETYLHVSPGIGTSVIPVRFNCPPEITLIKLQR